MSTRDWSRLGPVSVRSYTTERRSFGRSFTYEYVPIIKHYISFAEAVIAVGYTHVMALQYDRPKNMYLLAPGDDYQFLDELGFVIPVWRVKQEALSLSEKEWSKAPRWMRPRWSRRRDFVFRRGPVEGIRCYRGGGGWQRAIRTHAEIRENEALYFDADAKEVGIEPRGHRRNLRTSWDDPGRSDHDVRSWKKHRKTQWRA